MKSPESTEQKAFFSINCRGKLIDLTFPKIMAILNLTPDSFSDGGKFNEEKIARLIEKKGAQYSKKYLNNNGQTVIINNNTTSERPRNGVNISIGR